MPDASRAGRGTWMDSSRPRSVVTMTAEAMQSFRERAGGFHGNQSCYQQEPHEISRLETYRQHPHHAHPQLPHPGPGLSRSAYEARSLVNAASIATAKEIYSQPTYPGFPLNGGGSGNGGLASSQAKKKIPKFPTPTCAQHLQGHGGYGNPLGPGTYSAQYASGGHLQQKWEDSAALTSYEHELVGRVEAGGTPAPNSSQYVNPNMLGQCHQPPAQSYPGPHQQSHPADPSPSPLMYPQGHLHYPHPSPYTEKCSPIPPCYKGYSMTPPSQYGRQMSAQANPKPGGVYGPSQNSYGYRHSRSYEAQPPLQAMSSPQESHPKYQHFSQPQANYCLSELAVRSPEQYYQTCSPSSSHSPARSVGRSPSYSSTPSPLMTNPESFQYGQPPVTPSSSSASSAGHQEQGASNAALLPPRSHPSPGAASHAFANAQQQERFSEKLLSNPSLWSLNVLTSQVENISNNVQQLLLSETLVASKKSAKRNGSSGSAASSKKGEDYKSPYPESAGGVGAGPMQELYSSVQQHQRIPTTDLPEGGYSSGSDEQLERGYFYRSRGRSPAQPPGNTRIDADAVSSRSVTSPDARSGDSGLRSYVPDPMRCQSAQGGASPPVKSIGEGRSPVGVTVPSPMKPAADSSSDVQQVIQPVKENFEGRSWTDRSAGKGAEAQHERDVTQPKEKWPDEDKCSSLYGQVSKGGAEKDFGYTGRVQRRYDPDSLQGCSDPGRHFAQDVKEAHESHPSIASESSLKTFSPASDFEQDRYSTEKEKEKEGSTGNASPTSQTDKRPKKAESVGLTEEGNHGRESKSAEPKRRALSHSRSDEVRKGRGQEESMTSDSANNRHASDKPSADLYDRTETQRPERRGDKELAGVPAHPNVAAAPDSSSRESAICDSARQPRSAMPVFSALGDNHIDHGDAKVLEPDSPQLPGKSILPSAPSWADTPPSPKKGDEDVEPGLSCSSAVTPSAKPELVAPSAQPRPFGRKHAGGGGRKAIGRRVSSGRDGEGDPHSKTVLFSNQTEFARQQSIASQAAEMLTESLRSRMCTRSYNAADLPSKGPAHLKRNPGPKPGLKKQPKPGSKLAPKPGPKAKAAPNPQTPTGKIGAGAAAKRKLGPRPGVKPQPEPGPQSASPPAGDLGDQAPVGRPKGSVSKVKLSRRGEIATRLTGTQAKGRKKAPAQIKQHIRVIRRDENDIEAQQNHDKNMTLRSRRPSQTKGANEKEKNVHKDLLTATLAEIGAADCCEKEECSTEAQSGKAAESPTEAPEMLPADERATLPLQSQSSVEPSMAPVKKRRGPKPKAKAKALGPQAAAVPGARGKRGPPGKESEVPYRPQRATDGDPGDAPVGPPHCLTRTKVLPPRKGRGQKYEAMVQKITSPGSKKFLPSPQADGGLRDDAATKDGETAIPVDGTEVMASEVKSGRDGVKHPEGKEVKRESEKQRDTSQEEDLDLKQRLPEGDAKGQEHKPGTVRRLQRAMEAQVDLGPRGEWTQRAKALVGAAVSTSKSKSSKRKPCATGEGTRASVVASGSGGSPVVTAPRAAKQRAIKNNREMHLKQKRKRKSPPPAGAAKQIKVEAPEEQEWIAEETATPLRAPAVTTASDHIKGSPEVGRKAKRGRKPAANPAQRRPGKASSGEISDKPLKVYKKPGPKPGMKDAMEVIEAVVRAAGCEAERAERRKPETEAEPEEKRRAVSEQRTQTISGKRFRNEPVQRSLRSFCPYVRMNNSRDFSSWCAVVNKPEDVQVFQRRRKKGILRMKNPFTVAKVVPRTAAMLQGAAVDAALAGRPLACCLCRKPPNYRDLGDLCGPYYTEDRLPRKLLAVQPAPSPPRVRGESDEDRARASKWKAEGEAPESPQAGAGGRRHRRPYGRAERRDGMSRKDVPPRLPLRQRLRRIRQIRAGLADDRAGPFRRRREEAQADEHWAHENCAIWTKGVIMVAGRLYGLKEAADNSAQTNCRKCRTAGASLSCCWRSCSRKYHYVCAKEIGCTFHEDDFSIKCPKHEDL